MYQWEEVKQWIFFQCNLFEKYQHILVVVDPTLSTRQLDVETGILDSSVVRCLKVGLHGPSSNDRQNMFTRQPDSTIRF